MNTTEARPFHSLTPSHFLTHPIWESAVDLEQEEGKDDTWVRPIEGEETIRERHISVFARATARLADGTGLPAVLDVRAWPDLRLGGVYFWINGAITPLALAPAARTVRRMFGPERFAEQLGKGLLEVFPIHLGLQVPIEGQTGPLLAEIDTSGIISSLHYDTGVGTPGSHPQSPIDSRRVSIQWAGSGRGQTYAFDFQVFGYAGG